jgi:hypothetical protein
MSWSASLSGHVGTKSGERDLLTLLRSAVKQLNSDAAIVSTASVVTSHYGRVDLLDANSDGEVALERLNLEPAKTEAAKAETEESEKTGKIQGAETHKTADESSATDKTMAKKTVPSMKDAQAKK